MFRSYSPPVFSSVFLKLLLYHFGHFIHGGSVFRSDLLSLQLLPDTNSFSSSSSYSTFSYFFSQDFFQKSLYRQKQRKKKNPNSILVWLMGKRVNSFMFKKFSYTCLCSLLPGRSHSSSDFNWSLFVSIKD